MEEGQPLRQNSVRWSTKFFAKFSVDQLWVNASGCAGRMGEPQHIVVFGRETKTPVQSFSMKGKRRARSTNSARRGTFVLSGSGAWDGS
jgi:hypothetical protein